MIGRVLFVNEILNGVLCLTDSTAPLLEASALTTVPSSSTRSRIKWSGMSRAFVNLEIGRWRINAYESNPKLNPYNPNFG